MARELVLIPKTKYEHLLKLSENYIPNEQIGGQREDRELSSPDLDMENNNSREKQMSSKDENQVGSDSKVGNETSPEEKPRLYVDKPLSKMPFDRIKLASPTKKRKRVKTNIDIGLLNNEKKKNSANTKFSRKKQTESKDKRKGAKWINYVI